MIHGNKTRYKIYLFYDHVISICGIYADEHRTYKSLFENSEAKYK